MDFFLGDCLEYDFPVWFHAQEADKRHVEARTAQRELQVHSRPMPY